MWGSMPYIHKNELHQVLLDLPPCREPGRSGRPTEQPTAARVALSVDLQHLEGHVDKGDIARAKSKYINLPDLYWENNIDAVITPERFDELGLQVVQQKSKAQHPKLWEICSCSGALSRRARVKRVPHLPPIDMRYG